jgi:DNA-binding Xre family transcriptional regulator
MPSSSASEYGKKNIKNAIVAKGWTSNDLRWLIAASKYLDVEPSRDWDAYLTWNSDLLEAELCHIVAQGISKATWKRFLNGSPVRTDTFKACCQALGLDWQDIVEHPLLSSSQSISGVQAHYTDPKNYVGIVWTQIIPEKQNTDKRHMITINWGSWSWQKVKIIPSEGLILQYRKRLKNLATRVITVSTFADQSTDRVDVITEQTKIINSHLPIEDTLSCTDINRGWKEISQELPIIESSPSKSLEQSIIKSLKGLVLEQELVDRAIQGCDSRLQNENNTLMSRLLSQKLTRTFFSHSLVFDCVDVEKIHVNTTIKLLDMHEIQIGNYHFITTLQGEVYDDFLIIDRENSC